ncbi:MAG: IS1595 family transposase, partial [Intestinibacter sp.]
LCVYLDRNYKEVAKKLNLKLMKVSKGSRFIYTAKNAFEYNTKLGNWLRNFKGVATKYLNNYLIWFKFLFISKKYKEFNRIKELFMELATGDLYVTQYMIKNRFVEML